MLKYIGKRLLMMIPVILGISFILFTIMDLTPGDPARAMLGEYASQQEVDQLREEMGLNDNFFTRYGRYVINAVQGDLGVSYRTNSPAIDEIKARFPATLKIAFLAVLIAVVIGIPVGIVSAVKQYSLRIYRYGFGSSVYVNPPFWLGLLMILLFSVQLRILPAVGSDTWKHFLMPAAAMAAPRWRHSYE